MSEVGVQAIKALLQKVHTTNPIRVLVRTLTLIFLFDMLHVPASYCLLFPGLMESKLLNKLGALIVDELHLLSDVNRYVGCASTLIGCTHCVQTSMA